MRVFFLFLLSTFPLWAWELPDQCKQLIVGTTKDWNSSHVTITMYERKGSQWTRVLPPMQGRVGKKGLAWGRGMHPPLSQPYLKKEGDKRAPAGVFQLGAAFGYHQSIKKHRKLSYLQITSRDLWVEDSTSPFYNRHLRLQHEPQTRWEKKAQMRQNDYPHSLKLSIGHNSATTTHKAIPHAGSAIFFHIWRNGGKSATAGCTTLPEKQLRKLIRTIDPTKKPLYILLPTSVYKAKKMEWKLP